MDSPVAGDTICSLSAGNLRKISKVLIGLPSVSTTTATVKVEPTVNVPLAGVTLKEAARAWSGRKKNNKSAKKSILRRIKISCVSDASL